MWSAKVFQQLEQGDHTRSSLTLDQLGEVCCLVLQRTSKNVKEAMGHTGISAFFFFLFVSSGAKHANRLDSVTKTCTNCVPAPLQPAFGVEATVRISFTVLQVTENSMEKKKRTVP